MWKRRFVFAGLLVVLIAGLFVGWHFYTGFISDKELRDAIAEADRLDPGWRLEELEAKRAVISVAENSSRKRSSRRGQRQRRSIPCRCGLRGSR